MNQYGKNFIVFQCAESATSKRDVISEYVKFTDKTKQGTRKANDIQELNELPENENYSWVIRQWSGHRPAPIRVDNLYKPIFVSDVVKW